MSEEKRKKRPYRRGAASMARMRADEERWNEVFERNHGAEMREYYRGTNASVGCAFGEFSFQMQHLYRT